MKELEALHRIVRSNYAIKTPPGELNMRAELIEACFEGPMAVFCHFATQKYSIEKVSIFLKILPNWVEHYLLLYNHLTSKCDKKFARKIGLVENGIRIEKLTSKIK